MSRYAVTNLFGIEGFHIAWYGIIIAFGAMLVGILAICRSRKTGIAEEHIYNLAFLFVPVCLLCARAYYVAFEWENYKDNLWSVLQINNGGMAIYGGVIGGVVVTGIYCRIKQLSFLSLADTLIPGLLLGQSIGRWGNFVNQEAYGNQILNPKWQFFPYGVYIASIEQWRQATFFYESAANALLLLAMLVCSPRQKRKGYMLSYYMIGYGAIRFFVEGLRADSLYLFPGLRISQLLSLILVAGGVLTILLIRKTQPIERKIDQ